MVLGIPTVNRHHQHTSAYSGPVHQSYLQSTLQSIFINLQPEGEKDSLVVIFIAETDLEFVQATAKSIKAAFETQLDS